MFFVRLANVSAYFDAKKIINAIELTPRNNEFCVVNSGKYLK